MVHRSRVLRRSRLLIPRWLSRDGARIGAVVVTSPRCQLSLRSSMVASLAFFMIDSMVFLADCLRV